MKKLLVVATLSITVAAVIKRVADEVKRSKLTHGISSIVTEYGSKVTIL